MLILTDDRIKKVRNVLIIILFANLFVAILKMVVGNLINSASLTADGFHSLSDGASNIVGLVGIWFASKPVDKDHPYGHRKFETLAGMFIGCMLLFVGINVVKDAIVKLMNPSIPTISIASLIALIITLIINIFVSKLEYKAGKKLSSQILISDSMHTKSDIFVSIGVLVTLLSIKLGLPPIIDPIASLIVAAFIFHASYEIFRDAGSVLVDKAVVDEEKVKNIALEFTEVKDAHKIRSRGSEDDKHIDLHIMIDPNMNVESCHTLTHNISNRMKKEFGENVQVILHLEPFKE